MAEFVEENKTVGNESSQAQPKINIAASSNKQGDVGKNNTNRINKKKNDSDSGSYIDVNIRTDGKTVQENKNSSTANKTPLKNQVPDDTESKAHFKKKVKVPPKLKTKQEPKSSWLSKTISNALTSEHFDEIPYTSAPDIKNAVMIYDTIDEAMKTKPENYPYTKSFAQTNKTRKKSDMFTKAKDMFTKAKDNLKQKYNTKNTQYIQNIQKTWDTSKENRKKANEQSKQDKEELQESKVQAETEAKNLVDDLLEIDIDKIEPNNSLIIDLHIKIQQVEGGAKAYIAKLENEAMKGGKRGKRTRRKRLPVQKGGNNDNGDMEKEKKKKKLKIVNILKQLNSANYIDYEIESIIQELKRLLGPSSDVDTSIPETIETTTTVQEDMYSEPLPVCNKYDENVDNDSKCKENREKLKNRLQYFKKLKELNAMHNDNALVIFAENTFKDAENVIEFNKKTIEAYSKPYAKSDDTTTNKDDKDEQYLATLMPFEPIDKKDSTLDKKITKYNDIVKYLNKNKKHIVNPQLDEKLMTTNTKQTVTQSSSLKNILDVEHILNMIGSFNMGEYQSTYGNANNMGDPGHKKTSDITVVKSTDILRKPENNVNAK